MKILLISSYLPYPLYSGGQVRLYNLIKELSAKHEITLICEKRKHQTKGDIKAVAQICKKVITVGRRNQWSLKNLVQSTTSSHSFLVTGHMHPEMQKKIQHELKHNSFDLIHVETFYVMQNLPKSPVLQTPPLLKGAGGIPVVLIEHNIEYLVYKKYLQQVPLYFRPLLNLDIAKIKREEELCWKQATRLVAVSEDDKKVMQEKGFSPSVVANGVNTKIFSFQEKEQAKEKKILFIGDFSWVQNRDSVKFIIEEIWPSIKSKVKSQKSNLAVKLWIVGRVIPDSIKHLSDDPDIIFDEEGSSKPTHEIFQEARVLLAPIRVGGGTSYKILEAMSCGTPVITMQMSADAIHAKDGEHLMTGKTAKELAEKTHEILQDKKLFTKIAKQGRELIEEKYTWKMIAKELEQVYLSL